MRLLSTCLSSVEFFVYQTEIPIYHADALSVCQDLGANLAAFELGAEVDAIVSNLVPVVPGDSAVWLDINHKPSSITIDDRNVRDVDSFSPGRLSTFNSVDSDFCSILFFSRQSAEAKKLPCNEGLASAVLCKSMNSNRCLDDDESSDEIDIETVDESNNVTNVESVDESSDETSDEPDGESVQDVVSTSPSASPTLLPSSTPSESPTISPTNVPSVSPTSKPTSISLRSPTTRPTNAPSVKPTVAPTINADIDASISPTSNPTGSLSSPLSNRPTFSPTFNPSVTVSSTTSPSSGSDIQNTGEEGDTEFSVGDFFTTESIIVSVALLFMLLLIFYLLIKIRNEKRYERQRRVFDSDPEREDKMLALTDASPVTSYIGAFKSMNSTLPPSPVTPMNEAQAGSSTQSVYSVHTLQTNVTPSDIDRGTLVRSVITNHTNYSEITDMILRTAPFMETREESEINAFLELVSTKLLNVIDDDSKTIDVDNRFLPFNSANPQKMSVSTYLKRLVQGLNFWYEAEQLTTSPVAVRAVLLAIHYLRKLKETLGFRLTTQNIHKTLATLLVVAAKFIEDKPISNKYWSTVAGISIDTVTNLEETFCFSLNFNFAIEQQDLEDSFQEFGLL